MVVCIGRELNNPWWYHIGLTGDVNKWDDTSVIGFGPYNVNGAGFCPTMFEQVTGVHLEPGEVRRAVIKVEFL